MSSRARNSYINHTQKNQISTSRIATEVNSISNALTNLRRFLHAFVIIALIAGQAVDANAQYSQKSAQSVQTEIPVALAGFAYAGAESTISLRFPHTARYEQMMTRANTSVFKKIDSGIKAMPPTNFTIVDQIDELKGRDQALAVALVVGSETVVVEQLGSMYKLLALIRGQAMFFDFKSMNVVRTYPISFAYVDLFNQPPTEQEIASRVQMVYEGAGGKPGIISRFVHTVSRANIPTNVPRFVQVTSAQIAPEALEHLPSFIKSNPGSSEMWLADIVGEAISTRMSIPIVPFSKGYAVGNVMSMRVSDGKVWELKLPQPDYEISVDLTGLKKIKISEVVGGATSFVYGAYANLRIEDALKKGLNTGLKNGETRVIPASQRFVDDFPHFYDAINGMFTKVALSMSTQASHGNGTESTGTTTEAASQAAQWLKTAASAKDIGQQVDRVRNMLLTSR